MLLGIIVQAHDLPENFFILISQSDDYYVGGAAAVETLHLREFFFLSPRSVSSTRNGSYSPKDVFYFDRVALVCFFF